MNTRSSARVFEFGPVFPFSWRPRATTRWDFGRRRGLIVWWLRWYLEFCPAGIPRVIPDRPDVWADVTGRGCSR